MDDEDMVLVDAIKALVDTKGTVPWLSVAKLVPGRSAKQCRERWGLNLNPNIDRSAFSEQEDLLLLELHNKFGNRWSSFREFFPGRTENILKTRYKSLLRAEKRKWKREEDTKLTEAVAVHGRNWGLISSLYFPGIRTRNAIKMRVKALEDVSGDKTRFHASHSSPRSRRQRAARAAQAAGAAQAAEVSAIVADAFAAVGMRQAQPPASEKRAREDDDAAAADYCEEAEAKKPRFSVHDYCSKEVEVALQADLPSLEI